jgi:DNA invertase Pin-like site-specific DNA recombinase
VLTAKGNLLVRACSFRVQRTRELLSGPRSHSRRGPAGLNRGLRRSYRPLCRLRGAKLIIAKLDRLARNVAFISNLMESGVEFEAVDFPQANRLTIHIMAAMAEHEAKMISDRTKAALAAAKRRGVKLGGDRGARLTAAARAAGRAALQAKAQERASDLAATIKELKAAGCESLRDIAEGLEDRGIPAARGGKWSAVQVARLLDRAGLSRPFEPAVASAAGL